LIRTQPLQAQAFAGETCTACGAPLTGGRCGACGFVLAADGALERHTGAFTVSPPVTRRGWLLGGIALGIALAWLAQVRWAREHPIDAAAPVKTAVVKAVRQAPVQQKVPPVVSDTVSQAEIMSVVLAHKPEVLGCVRGQRASDADIHGTLVMGWSVERDGTTRDVSAYTPEFGGAPVVSCLVRSIRSWKFPAHTAAQPQVRFPFKF
jgi:hypothetical protein